MSLSAHSDTIASEVYNAILKGDHNRWSRYYSLLALNNGFLHAVSRRGDHQGDRDGVLDG